MSGDEPTLGEVLARREARQAAQQALLDARHMPLVSFTVVAPGPVKRAAWIVEVFAEGAAEIAATLEREQWAVWERQDYDGPTGPELLLAVDADPGDLKRAVVALEEAHPWGRLWDVDVVSETHGVVTRPMVGAEARRCLVCERPSPECARSRRHGVPELLGAVAAIVGHD